jgi:glucokinase
MNKLAIGADIGGSHITCQVFDIENQISYENTLIRKSVDSHGSKDEIIASWAEAIKKTAETVGLNNLAGIGFAMPGPFDYPNGIAWFNADVQKFENLHGVDVKSELINQLGLSPDFSIRFLNDASCFAIGEAWLGEAANYKRIIAITLGTGFGTTFINNHLPVAGVDGIPKDGFLYHIPFQHSIADDYFSTRWFLKEYNEKTGKQVSDVRELARLAKADSEGLEIFQRFGENLGSFLVSWIEKFNADCIVLGGNISKSFSLFQKQMEHQFEKYGLQTAICLSKTDETAALFGSAKLCDDNFYRDIIQT